MVANVRASEQAALVQRIRAEYVEMPGMTLRREQVARLCGIERSACQTLLDALVDVKFLFLKADSQATGPNLWRPYGDSSPPPPRRHDRSTVRVATRTGRLLDARAGRRVSRGPGGRLVRDPRPRPRPPRRDVSMPDLR